MTLPGMELRSSDLYQALHTFDACTLITWVSIGVRIRTTKIAVLCCFVFGGRVYTHMRRYDQVSYYSCRYIKQLQVITLAQSITIDPEYENGEV